MTEGVGDLRLAEVVALLSLGTDLGLGQPMEHMIRTSLLALRMAERLGLSDEERGVMYYSGLLAWVGCHTDAYEQAKWLGDDMAVKGEAHYAFDLGKVGPATAFLLRNVGGAGRSLRQRARVGLGFVGDGRRALAALAENHYLASDELAARLDLGVDVRESLRQSYERWDGKGAFKLKGEQIAITSRLVNLADVVEVYRRTGGIDAATEVARQRSGTQFDPELVRLFCGQATTLFAGIDEASTWGQVIEAHPVLTPVLEPGRIDEVLDAVGEFAELKSPWRLGHSRGVSHLVEGAGKVARLPEGEVAQLRRAAVLADIGQLGISNSILDKAEPLTPSEVERFRLHPYLSERMLSFSPALAPLGATAMLHHERMDGSGYPRGLAGSGISRAGRLLAAADAYQSLVEPRPYRAAHSADAATAELRSAASAGKLDGDAVHAVLAAAGRRTPRREDWPSGLTTREVEVLRLVARGMSNKEVATRLVISVKTAGTHVEHIYKKIGASNRAQAGLYAAMNGLMSDGS